MEKMNQGLPRWKSHKVVEAFKITAIVYRDGEVTVCGSGKEPIEIKVSRQYMEKHNPQEGGYYVRYADGYESFSPAKAFEEGYIRLDNTAPGECGTKKPSDKPFLKIIYTGSHDAALDSVFKDGLSSSGFTFVGSGFNLNTGERDLLFKKKETQIPKNNFEAKTPLTKPPLGVMPEKLFLEARIADLSRAIHDRFGMVVRIGPEVESPKLLIEWANELVRRLRDLEIANMGAGLTGGTTKKTEVRP